MASRLVLALLAPMLFAFGAPLPPPSASTGPSRPAAAGRAIDPTLRPTPTVSPQHAARSAGRRGPAFRIMPASEVVEATTARGARYPHLGRNGPLVSRPAPVAPALATRTPLSTAATPSPSVALYNGLNNPGMAASINAAQEAPPDSTGAIGPNNYVEMVNSAIAVYRRDLSFVNSRTLPAWVGASANTPYCDPQIQWDPTAGRWLYVFLFCDPTNSAIQHFRFGWSKTADPSNLASGWCHFGVTTSPYIFDFPKLGHNSKYLIVGGNAYDTRDPKLPFGGAAIVWIAKPAKGLTTCTLPSAPRSSSFPLLNGDGTKAFTPVPVNTMTGAANGYVVSAHDPSRAPQTRLGVWQLDSSGVLHTRPDISTVTSFTFPGPAPEAGTSTTIDTSDGRLTQAVGDPTTGIWTQHTVAGLGGRSVVRWYEIKVAGGVASLAQHGEIASATDFVFNGAVSPRFDGGGAAVVYNRSSSTLNPVIAAQVRVTATTSGAMEPGEIVLQSSLAADQDFSCSPGVPCRWGDYSGASPDPVVQNVVWGTSEVNTASGSDPAWADQNFAVQVIALPHTPTAISATAGDKAATVFWTPSPFYPGSPVTSYTITPYVGVTAGLPVAVAAPATSAYFPGLTNGVTYTFTVTATNIIGDSPESVQSNPVTPPRQTAQSSPPGPSPTPRPPVSQSSPAPGPIPPR